jgi:lysophospholipase L1-like esterase
VSSVPGAATSAPAPTSPTVATTTVSLPPLGTKVAIVGDSLTEGVRTRITPFAARYGFDAKIDAENGRDIEAGLSPLKKIVTGRDLVMVALGTNDARTGLTAADAQKRIDEVMAQVAGKPVLWVNIYRSDTKGTMAAADLFDQQLTAATSRYPNLTVLDWSSYIQSRPELMGEDHIHLTSDGYMARADWMARQIATGLRLPLPDAPELNR